MATPGKQHHRIAMPQRMSSSSPLGKDAIANYRKAIADSRARAARELADTHSNFVSVDARTLEDLCDLVEAKLGAVHRADLMMRGLKAVAERSSSPLISQIATCAMIGKEHKAMGRARRTSSAYLTEACGLRNLHRFRKEQEEQDRGRP